MKNRALNLVFISLFFVANELQAQQINASFQIPNEACVGISTTFTNTSTGPATNYYWNICSGGPSIPPVTGNIINPSNVFSGPVYCTLVKDGLNYYMFVTNNFSGHLSRLDYGNNLNNTPTAIDLGFIINNLEDIHIEKEGGNWYGIALGGLGSGSSICRVSFGSSITNIPTVINMGNIGSLTYPVTLYIFKSGGNIFGLTFNHFSSTITRFNFGSSIANVPTGINLGNIGSLSLPGQMSIISDAGNWYAFISNDDTPSSITRLDFGNSLLNTPTGTNLGNFGGVINGPRGLCLWKECGGIKGLLANRGNNTLFDLSFPLGAGAPLNISPSVYSPNLNFPQTIRRYRNGDEIRTYIVNVLDNSLSHISVLNCVSLPSSTQQNYAPITFTSTGSYTVTLAVNETEYNQDVTCQVIVSKLATPLTVSPSQTICIGKTAQLSAAGAQNYTWSTGSSSATVIVNPFSTTIYSVQAQNVNSCVAKASLTVVVSECVGIAPVVSLSNLQIFPNPSSGIFIIEVQKPNTQLSVYDQLGRIILETEIQLGRNEINLQEYPAGIYSVVLKNSNEFSTMKLIKTD